MTQTNNHSSDEWSLRELVTYTRSTIQYIFSKWLLLLIFAILGASLGLAYSIIKKPLYTASSTFVLDDGNKSGGLSQYAGLASMAGIDLTGGGGNGGIFQGDNILELYKSRSMLEKALLSESVFNKGKQLLIDRYIEFHNLKKKWQEKDNIQNISFTGNPDNFSRTQDSIITDLVTIFNKSLLTVTKPDKKIAIIRVDVTDKDELFAKNFNQKLVETVNEFYLQTKTKKSGQNIKILQHQADSVRNVLNNSIYGVASALDASPNANPSLQILRAPSQRKQIDVQASTAIYSEMIKNMELSKMSLRQETPLIQIIDAPVLPLYRKETSKVAAIFLGSFFGIFVISFWVVIKKAFVPVSK